MKERERRARQTARGGAGRTFLSPLRETPWVDLTSNGYLCSPTRKHGHRFSGWQQQPVCPESESWATPAAKHRVEDHPHRPGVDLNTAAAAAAERSTCWRRGQLPNGRAAAEPWLSGRGGGGGGAGAAAAGGGGGAAAAAASDLHLVRVVSWWLELLGARGTPFWRAPLRTLGPSYGCSRSTSGAT